MSLLMMIGDAVGSGPPKALAAWSPQLIANAIPYESTCVCALSETTAIVVYSDQSNSYYGTAVHLTITGTSISAGTPKVFNSASTTAVSVTKISATEAVVCYANQGASGAGTAVHLTVNGTSFDVGDPEVFETGGTYYTSVCTLSSTSVLVAYKDGGNSSYGTACQIDVSGASLSPGNPIAFTTGGNTLFCDVCALSSTSALVVYIIGAYVYSCQLGVSGQTVSPGTEGIMAQVSARQVSVTALSATSAVATYERSDQKGYYIPITITGSSVGFGTPVIFEDARVNWTSIDALDSVTSIVCYMDDANSDYGTACVTPVSGTPETVVFESATTTLCRTCALSPSAVLVSYSDGGNSSYITACVITYS